MAGINEPLASGNDIKFFDFNLIARTWSEKTDILLDDANIKSATVIYNENNNDLYAVYSRGAVGSENIYYKISTNGGTTWSGESTALNDAADDFRYIRGNLFSPDILYVTYFNDDTEDLHGSRVPENIDTYQRVPTYSVNPQ